MDGDVRGKFENFSEAQRHAWQENYAQYVLHSCIGQLEAVSDKGAYSAILQPVVAAARIALAHVKLKQEGRMEGNLHRKKENKNDRED